VRAMELLLFTWQIPTQDQAAPTRPVEDIILASEGS
jgi:hypothetical protein